MQNQTSSRQKEGTGSDSLEARSQARKARLVSHRTHSFDQAENWDLRFWQEQGPEGRLAALLALHADLRIIEAGKEQRRKTGATKEGDHCHERDSRF